MRGRRAERFTGSIQPVARFAMPGRAGPEDATMATDKKPDDKQREDQPLKKVNESAKGSKPAKDKG